MSRSNVETVKRVYELAADAWRDVERQGVARLADLYHPDVVVQERADFPDSDTYGGYAGLARWWAGFFEIYDEVTLEPQEYLLRGDCVVVRVLHRLRSKGGVALEQEVAHVFTLRDGQITHMTGYGDVAQALEAVGRG